MSRKMTNHRGAIEPVKKEDYELVAEENYSTTFSNFNCKVYYPKENPKFAMNDINDTLSHIGIYDDVK